MEYPDQVAHLRKRNELSLGEAALIGIPAGIGLALLGETTIGVIIAFTLAIVAGIGLDKSGRFAGATAYQDEFRSTDYSPIQRFSPLVGLMATVFLAANAPFDSLVEIGVSAELQHVVSAIAAIGTISVGLKFESARSHKMGRRRLAALQSKQKGLSDEALVPSPRHMKVISAIVAIGAVDGMRTSLTEISRLLGYDAITEIKELEKAGYLNLQRQYGWKGETTYKVTLIRIP